MKTSFDAASTMLAALAAMVNGGSIRVYTGSAPSSVEDDPTGSMLVEVPLAATAFGVPANVGTGARATANAVTPGDIVAAGDAGYFRACKADGTPEWQGTVGVEQANPADNPDLILTNVTLEVGDALGIASLTVTHPIA